MNLFERFADSLRRAFEEVAKDMAPAPLPASAQTVRNELEKLSRLPLTGGAMEYFLQGIEAGYHTLKVVSAGELPPHVLGMYSGRVLSVSEGISAPAWVHEVYHAQQEYVGIQNGVDLSALGVTDFIWWNLLMEAAAVAYTFLVLKEADKRTPGVHERMTHSHSEGFGRKDVFDRAYEDAWKKTKDEKAALTAGGQAVVQSLVRGENRDWLKAYSETAVRNMRKIVRNQSRDAAADRELARRAFLSMGKVSHDINVVPPGCLTPPDHPSPFLTFVDRAIRAAPSV